jgi:hypothetical protein
VTGPRAGRAWSPALPSTASGILPALVPAGSRGILEAMSAARKSYDEIVELFARGGGAGAVLAFRPSDEASARVRDLLERSKVGQLDDEEQAELDRFAEMEGLMQLVKARARRLSA